MITKTGRELSLYRFTVTYADSPSSTVATVQACYMQEEGRFLTFKDPSHGVVLAVNVDAVIAVQREDLVEGEVTE